jgi:hypothetical protein
MAKKSGLITTVVFVVALVGTIAYSVIDRHNIDTILDKFRQESQLRTLKGFVSVDVEPFFKDARVQQILADNHFRVEAARMGSRDMATKVSTAPDAPQFFMPSGVLAAQMITAAARQHNIIESLHFLAGGDDSLTGRLTRLANRERVVMLPFSSEVYQPVRFDIPADDQAKAAVFAGIRRYADQLTMDGSTRLYDATLAALKFLASEKEKQPGYLYSVVLFTDGELNQGLDWAGFRQVYAQLPPAAQAIPVFTILYGEGNVQELEEVAKLTHGKTFDARKAGLAAVFKEIRAYQ